MAVTPIIGEFGYLVFDIQPRVRAWLRGQDAERKIVFAPREIAPLFEEATEIIEPPAELLPTAPATMRSIVYEHWRPGDPERAKIERLVTWARSQVLADEWLEVPYFQGEPWAIPATYTQLKSDRARPSEPFVAIAARSRDFDAWRNWPATSWDELVARIRESWNVEVRCIGRPPSTYFPAGTEPQLVDDLDRLDDSIALLNHAICSISSNSGPTHLSLMAGCPTFAWGEPYLKTFMEQTTNPLGTPCCFFPGGWDPTVDSVWNALSHWRKTMEAKKVWRGTAVKAVRVSMCMIARNSERTLKAALESIKPWVDEMVVVDTGSTDDTASIAAACDARVFHSPWQDSFSAARNESIRNARGEWILWIDSDDTINPINGQKLRDLVEGKHSPSTMGYIFQVNCPAASDAAAYATATMVDHVKLFRRIPAISFSGRIHEQILPSIRRLGGEVQWTDIVIDHSGSDQSISGRDRKHKRDMRLIEMELAEDPDNTFTLFNLGMTLLDMDRPADALNAFCRSLQLAERGESHIRKLYALLAQAYSGLKRPVTALRTCLQGLIECPQDPELLFRKGVLEQALGQFEAAERSFRTIVDVAHERHFSSFDRGILDVKVWHNLGVLYVQQQRPKDALEAWLQVLKFNRNNKDAWRGLLDASITVTASGLGETIGLLIENGDIPHEVRCILDSRAMVESGQIREALGHLKNAFYQSGSVEVLEELCHVSFSHYCLDVAEWALCELTKLSPYDPAAFQNLSIVYLRRHNYTKAAQTAQRSLGLRPESAMALQVLTVANQCSSAADQEFAQSHSQLQENMSS